QGGTPWETFASFGAGQRKCPTGTRSVAVTNFFSDKQFPHTIPQKTLLFDKFMFEYQLRNKKY
ncbi:MAG: hypothetical protein IKK94_08475, partial [Clostridia bacterium]|nr:hypothetical protein [Clostridia bacterium]